jgi:SAM-dependent methyltransferase
VSDLAALLRCPRCEVALELERSMPEAGYPELGPDGVLRCARCASRYPLIAGTVRILGTAMQERLIADYPRSRAVLEACLGPGRGSGPDHDQEVKRRTADSFAYEWQHFGQPRPEWRRNFLDYMRPHRAESFAGKLVLDVGAGSGRHSREAVALGARVVAVDIGRAIDVARSNLPPEVLTVQADAEQLPLARGEFDFVCSLGVLHHLPVPRRALRALVPYARPGGHVHVYLYWVPARLWHRLVLAGVGAARRVTWRMPHGLLHALCYPLAAGLLATIVAPYRALRHRPRGRRLAATLPLKAYADYPFGVLVNDQFDRFSAPLERRFTQDQVRSLVRDAGLTDVVVLPNHGWVADARRPASQARRRSTTPDCAGTPRA